jgi:hypothetical protein
MPEKWRGIENRRRELLNSAERL